MTITRNFKLYLNAGTASAPYINVNQYDEGEEWVFTLYNEDGSTYTPSTGAIIGIKSDGNAIMNSGSVVGGKVVITETEQMTAASGRAIYELLIDNATHGTANFIVNVERRPSDDAEFSDSDLSMLQEAIDAAEVINEILDEGGDPSEIIAENVNNWLDNHPEATTTVEDGAITAPKINQSLWDKLLVNEEASGAVASFDDGADDVPVSSLKVALEPIQTGSGDPSPSNIRPISGHSSVTVERTGINLFDASVANHGKRWKSTGLETMSNVSASAKIPCLPNTDYYLHDVAGENNGVPAVYFWDADDTYISNVVIQGTSPVSQMVTSPANAMYMGINYMTAQESTVGVNCNGVTEYVPYKGEKYPYTLGREVYGGTVDLATGVLTVTHKMVELNGNSSISYDANRFYANGFNDFARKMEYTRNEIISDKLPTVSNSGAVTNNGLGITGYTNATSYPNQNWIYFGTGDPNITTPVQMKEWLAENPITVCYELKTPQTIQLTPQEVKTLLGYNNISSSGTVEVIYHADTKLYVDKMTAVDNNIIAPIEADFVATRNYTVNDLLIVNDTLYKVTSNIQNGGTITPNSNVTQTTLSALIKALS